MTKVCPKCGVEKDTHEFYRRQMKRYLTSYCKTCLIERALEWNKTHKERCRESRIRYRLSHREKINTKAREMRAFWKQNHSPSKT